jgi:hypothetical protein
MIGIGFGEFIFLSAIGLGVSGWIGAVRERAQYSESHRRWRLCDTCGEVHDGFHRCREKLVGFCIDCQRKRFISRSSTCPAGHREIVNIHFRWNQQRAEYPV